MQDKDEVQHQSSDIDLAFHRVGLWSHDDGVYKTVWFLGTNW